MNGGVENGYIGDRGRTILTQEVGAWSKRSVTQTLCPCGAFFQWRFSSFANAYKTRPLLAFSFFVSSSTTNKMEGIHSNRPHNRPRSNRPVLTFDPALPLDVLLSVANQADLTTCKYLRRTGRFATQALTLSWFLSRHSFLYKSLLKTGGSQFALDITRARRKTYRFTSDMAEDPRLWMWEAVQSESSAMLRHSLMPITKNVQDIHSGGLGLDLVGSMGEALLSAAKNGWEEGLELLLEAYVRSWDSLGFSLAGEGPDHWRMKVNSRWKTKILTLLSATKEANDAGHSLCGGFIAAEIFRDTDDLVAGYCNLRTLGSVVADWGRRSAELLDRMVVWAKGSSILDELTDGGMDTAVIDIKSDFLDALIVNGPRNIISHILPEPSHDDVDWLDLLDLIVKIAAQRGSRILLLEVVDRLDDLTIVLDEDWRDDFPWSLPLAEAIEKFEENGTNDAKVREGLTSLGGTESDSISF
jgi:hypothetical protein